MQKTKLVFLALAVASLTGCSSVNQAMQAPTASEMAVSAQLPTSCDISSIMSQLDSDWQAWDKTEPAKIDTEIVCSYGIPYSDVGFGMTFKKETSSQWQKEFQASEGSNWISDTITSKRYSLLYQEIPDEGLGPSYEVKVFVNGVVIDYNQFGSYDKNEPVLLAGIEELSVSQS